jgi:NDP-sugar pyrophosphorylase family protein
MNIVIPMAGLGSRFSVLGIQEPKPLIVVNGKPLVQHSIESLGLDGNYIFITRKYNNNKYNEELSSLLQMLKPGSKEIMVDSEQYGAADTCLYAEDIINNDEELVITNCDQILSWNSLDFLSFIKENDPSGCVAIFESEDPKNSFAKIYDGIVTEIQEKNQISTDALVGIHYWKHGKDFCSSAKKLKLDYKKLNMKEAYIGPTYNYMISNLQQVLPYRMPKNSYISLGTPEDVSIYESKVKEYYTDKPKTIFCDIDGTIIKHVHRFSHLGSDPAIALSGVIDKFNEWDSRGHKIILTTARKESARSLTEKQLTELGLCWDQLVMGVTSGVRVLINDKQILNDQDRAVSINLLTDEGFLDYNWKDLGL